MKKYYYDYLDMIIKFIRPTILIKNEIGDIKDIQGYFTKLRSKSRNGDRMLITYYNHLWEPILKIASFLGIRRKLPEQNWLDEDDISNLLNLSGWEVVTHQKRLLIPIYIPILSRLVNSFIAPLPIINALGLLTWTVARPKGGVQKEYSVTIVVPARNEEGNIALIPKNLPKFGKWQELIFVEGGSKDKTWEQIIRLGKRYKKIRIRAFKQKGRGKADAVKLGFKKARGEMLMILDADRTVDPSELPKFYEALKGGLGEFINGSRLVYPMEEQAMRSLNKAGNKLFSWLFTWILGQRFKDTLCGTKVLFKNDYLRIQKTKKFFGNFDPFGDFELIFGAVKLNLKVIEVPIRYKERTYGETNISRFKHGLILLKMIWFAYRKFLIGAIS